MFEKPPPRAGEVRALAQQLLAWADHLSARPDPAVEMSEEDRHDLVLGLATAFRDAIRMRTRIFPDAPLHNPNWELLLDLFIREVNGFRTSVERMTIGGERSTASMSRTIEILQRMGLVTLTVDKPENRRIWLSLSDVGKQRIFDLLFECADLFRPYRQAQPPGEPHR